MANFETFDHPFLVPERITQSVLVDDSVEHIDILLPYKYFSFDDDIRFAMLAWKALRVKQISDRTLSLADLSGYRQKVGTRVLENHEYQTPPSGIEVSAPFVTMDVYDGATEAFGRHHNDAALPILANEYVSRNHFSLTTRLGRSGLTLAIHDGVSSNGSKLDVVHKKAATELATAFTR